MNYSFSHYYEDTPADLYDENYYRLLKCCFDYSNFFLLRFKKDFYLYPNEICDSMEQLNPYLFCSFSEMQEPWCGAGYDRISIYHCNVDSFQIMREKTNRLFGWTSYGRTKLPEDLTFFREDGSVFFSQITHEGIATLYPRKNENVTGIIFSKGWRSFEENHVMYSPLSRYISHDVKLTDRQKQILCLETEYWVNWPQSNIDFLEKLKTSPDYRNDKKSLQDIENQQSQLRKLAQEKTRLLYQEVVTIINTIYKKKKEGEKAN